MTEPNNPFSALLGVSDPQSANSPGFSHDTTMVNTAGKIPQENDPILLNNVIENVFCFTINTKSVEGYTACDKQLVYLEELAQAIHPNIHIDLEVLEQALFERLLLPDIENYVIPKTNAFKEHVVEKQVFSYLFNSIQNLQSYIHSSSPTVLNAIKIMRELIFRNAVTALKQPVLFEGQDLTEQLVDLLRHVDPQSSTFFTDIVREFVRDLDEDSNMEQLRSVMISVLRRIQTDVNKANLISLPIYILPALQLFASNIYLAPVLMYACEPKLENNGRLYQDSVLGALLSLSVLPRNATSHHEFFDDPRDRSAVSVEESSIWNASSHLCNSIHRIFMTLLKSSSEMRNRILSWIGKCLKTNVDRGKLWNVEADEISAATLSCVSDGFMINLGAVLLKMCQPFCSTPDDPKSLKIDPTYGAVPPEECEAKQVHLDCLYNETSLLPAKPDENGQPIKRPSAETYNFVTECFFMTQKCIHLGVRVCAEKLSRCGQTLDRAQRAVADAALTAPHLVEPMRQRTQQLLTRYVSLRCALREPEMFTNQQHLQAMTCTWLVQVAIRTGFSKQQTSYAPGTFLPVNMPVTTPAPDTLRCIPEFVLENVVVLMARRTVGAIIEEAEAGELLHPALTLVITFMGDSGRTYNPHLRAKLAECLEAMLPDHPDDHQRPASSLASFYREQLFKDHPHRLQLVPCLLDVFVGIEMTGQNVEFEEKFNYRRPMYIVMDFLWDIEEHRHAFTRLAREAEANMEAVRPPLFLRFINLLINDAIFLLDDALGNIAQIRTLQVAQEAGSWNNLAAQEREQNLNNLTRIGMWARFANILGKNTIRTLTRLTEHAPYVFCHPTLAERIASMLNYFLLHLVGPNKKNFKVKDLKEYEFDPATTVLEICRMYVQLGKNKRFCAAVSNDGRSYSPQLFALAEQVLVRIGGGNLLEPLRDVAKRVAITAEERQKDEEILVDAPDEFLDPIMSTIMMDPVILPSSRTTVDRTTIARHLLSDQSDPFNRSPLSMDQVKSNTELKTRIETWIAEQKEKIAQAQPAQSSSQ